MTTVSHRLTIASLLLGACVAVVLALLPFVFDANQLKIFAVINRVAVFALGLTCVYAWQLRPLIKGIKPIIYSILFAFAFTNTDIMNREMLTILYLSSGLFLLWCAVSLKTSPVSDAVEDQVSPRAKETP